MPKFRTVSDILFWIVVSSAVLYFGTIAYVNTQKTFFWSQAGFESTVDTGGVKVVQVVPGLPADRAGLKPGDHLVRPDLRPYTRFTDLMDDYQRGQKLRVLTLKVRREDGRTADVAVPLPQPFAGGFLSSKFLFYVLYLLIPLLCSLIGIAICALRWKDSTSRLGGLLFLGLATMFGQDDFSLPTTVLPFVLLYRGILSSLVGYFFFAFFSEFPGASAFATKWRWVRTGYLALVLVQIAVSLLLNFTERYSFASHLRLRAVVPDWFFLVSQALFLVGGIGAFTNFLPGIRFPLDADQRRRGRVLIFGVLVGCLPLFLGALFHLMRYKSMTLDEFPVWIPATLISLFAVFPLTFAYTVIQSRVLGVQQLLRRSVQYAFLSRGYLVIEFFGLYALVKLASFFGVSLFPAMRIAPTDNAVRAFSYGVGAMGLYALWTLNPRLQTIIDRRFFRDAYQAQKVLTDLSRTVRSLSRTDELLERVAERISTAMHIERIIFFVRSPLLDTAGPASNDTFLGFVCSFDVARGGKIDPKLILRENTSLVRELRLAHLPVEVQFNAPDEWTERLALGGGDLARTVEQYVGERRMLAGLGAELLVPLAVKDNLLGIMCLGPKLSEEPYTGEDKNLLMTVAEATALRLENSQLIRQVTLEATLKRDLEIARDLQQRLLPSSDPVVAGLDVAGYSNAANEVGGDYYDFFPLDADRFAVAIGDVTGHGVSSGLLMALAKGGLHTQVGIDPTPTAVMTAMNRLICANGGKRNLMTFAYAVFDTRRGEVEFANAGHPYPYVFRRHTRTVESVEVTNYPLGVRPTVTFETRSVTLAAGDIVVFFSDGIIEAGNSAGDLFGFERLEKTLERAGTECAPAIRTAVLSDFQAFLAGGQPDDDVTLVVVRRV